MSEIVYISMPCQFKNRHLTIKALGFHAEGNSPEEALLECIANTALYIPLILAKFYHLTDHKGRKYWLLEVPYHIDIYEKIQEIEHFPYDTKKKTTKTLIVEPDTEETLKYGW